MSSPDLIEAFRRCAPAEQLILELLAVHGEPLGKTHLLACLRQLDVSDEHGKAYTAASLAVALQSLSRKKLAEETTGSGYGCAKPIERTALHAAVAEDTLGALIDALDRLRPVFRSYDGSIYVRSFRQAITRLRNALLSGAAPEQVYPWLDACLMFRESERMPPYVAALGLPFDAMQMALLHPVLRDQAGAQFLLHAPTDPAGTPALRAWAETQVAQQAGAGGMLRDALAEHYLLCGRLRQAEGVIAVAAGPHAHMLRASILLLRGMPHEAAIMFDAALKALRKEVGKRNIGIAGLPGFFYVLALLRAGDAAALKQADAYLDLTRRLSRAIDAPVYERLRCLRQVQAGALPPEAATELDRPPSLAMLPMLFQGLLQYWLGMPQNALHADALRELQAQSHANGFDWIAAQAAELLQRLAPQDGDLGAAALRKQGGFDDACDWFARQEKWQRQLDALLSLRSPAPPAADNAPHSRLAWLIDYRPDWRQVTVEPREQKRDARGNWTRGRPVALKRLREDADTLAFMTPQDQQAASAIRLSSSYYQGPGYDIDGEQAALELTGHPLVFWRDAPDIQVELLRGQPELHVGERDGQLLLRLLPAIDADTGAALIEKETPTRLRVYPVTDEHRRIATILGNGLSVPKSAREQVLQALGAMASIVTVQSDIGGGVTDAEPVEADPRLHLHLLPYGEGLKLQILVQPLGGGAYYAPGEGSDSVIAEVDGRRLQTRRDMMGERSAAEALAAACPALEQADHAHGEWILPTALASLELLSQLQAQADNIVIAWPQGETFRLRGQAGGAQLRLAVKSERDWFAASGELQVDDDTVLNLRDVLDLVRQSGNRFIALGDRQFVALTDEFHRRLTELAAIGELHGKGARVHPLASSVLDDLSGHAASFKADKAWKEHVARIAALEQFRPVLPNTLQADLRDYQADGYNWLARLAHWGVGACLADDMGLGKTVQTIALLLARAADGPALVVAPTSVCTNWIDETARFAPTLNTLLFGGGNDRAQLLAQLQPFDVLVVSYGLLQQHAEQFASIAWRTVVLDEAQAIKNAATKRSQAAMGLQADFRVALSGTPLENHLGELWNLFRFLNPGLLGSWEQFNRRFATPIEKERDANARAQLRRLIQPFMLRRTKTQVLAELPSRTEIVHHVELSAQEAALYETLRREAVTRLTESDAAGGHQQLQILAEIMKLRRACCHPQLVAPELNLASSKLAAFGELADELLANRHRALVFSQFVDHLSLIRSWLDARGIRYQYLDGATPMNERKKRVDAFQRGDGDIFLISLKAGGTGLNLTAADYVIHMDPWWNPAVEDQASDRAHRIGQQRPVTIYRLVTRGTIEEQIVDLHRKKRDLADSLLEGSDVSARMSAGDMLALLQGK